MITPWTGEQGLAGKVLSILYTKWRSRAKSDKEFYIQDDTSDSSHYLLYNHHYKYREQLNTRPLRKWWELMR